MARTRVKMNSMEEDKKTVPYIVYESAMARMERINQRSWIIIIILIACLLFTNLSWTVHNNIVLRQREEIQYETSVHE